MLTNPTLDQMQALGLAGMAAAWRELAERNNANELSRDEWLGLMLDREVAMRADKRVRNRLASARLRFPEACIEDIDFAAPRGLDRRSTMALAQGEWLKTHENLIVTGQTGTGKSWLACAFGRQAHGSIIPCSMCACRACSRIWRSLVSMAASHASSTNSPARNCSSSMTSELTASPTNSASICSKSSRNAIAANPP